MGIPNFDTDGLLPSGRHQCTLAEASNRFAFNDVRVRLWRNLGSALSRMEEAGLSGVLYLDGSFVTDKSVPGDIEVAFDVRAESDRQQGLALLFYHNNHDLLKSELMVDWYPVLPGNNDFVRFFEYVGDKTAIQKNISPKKLKGILKVTSWQQSR